MRSNRFQYCISELDVANMCVFMKGKNIIIYTECVIFMIQNQIFFLILKANLRVRILHLKWSFFKYYVHFSHFGIQNNRVNIFE